ncbi:MAG: hypothetical protein M1341_03900 [Candidatus Thermoplasmatota archaeon]|jgi:hypothetical protein|nr:hypothetical protein [Candidatus Thermoplasmatota archaeon]
MNSSAGRGQSGMDHAAYGNNEDSKVFTVYMVPGRHPYHPKFLDESDISVESIEYEVFAEDQQNLQH